MAVSDFTQLSNEDKAILAVSREYIRITESSPGKFIDELMDLASQCVNNSISDFHQILNHSDTVTDINSVSNISK